MDPATLDQSQESREEQWLSEDHKDGGAGPRTGADGSRWRET